MRFSLFAVASVLFGGVLASNVIDLDPDNFDTIIGKGKPALVELYVDIKRILSVQLLTWISVLHHGVGIARI
jgi:hypothetical protein